MKINLFILGLGENVDTIKLIELFSSHGTVDSVHIATDQRSHKSLGYGFVQMTDKLGADRAVQALNGAKMNGKTLQVRIAEKKNKKTTAKPSIPAKPSQPVAQKQKRPRISKSY